MPATKTLSDARIRKEIAKIKQKYKGKVVNIFYEIGTDRVGDPAVYFRVLVPDKVAEDWDGFGKVALAVRDDLIENLDFADTDYMPYTNFRSVSEQAEMKDPEWE